MRVIPSDFACSYIKPSTSLDTALVHSEDNDYVEFAMIRIYGHTIQDSEFGLVVEHPAHAHLR